MLRTRLEWGQSIVGVMLLMCSLSQLQAAENTAASSSRPATVNSGKVLRHVVLFQFKSDTTADKQKEIENAFRELPKKIKAIVDFEWGTDVSAENLAAGFTHCFLVTFADIAGRDEYLPHPEHQKFVDLVKPHIEKVLVIDYWTQH